jgi:uncharacterized BrkB/YihY/UPF0761 family membrane protein
VGFLTWVWISIVILLAGAELNCEIGKRRARAAIARQQCDRSTAAGPALSEDKVFWGPPKTSPARDKLPG